METITNSKAVEDFCTAVDKQIEINKKWNKQIEKELIRRANEKKQNEKDFEEKMKLLKRR